MKFKHGEKEMHFKYVQTDTSTHEHTNFLLSGSSKNQRQSMFELALCSLVSLCLLSSVPDNGASRTIIWKRAAVMSCAVDMNHSVLHLCSFFGGFSCRQRKKRASRRVRRGRGRLKSECKGEDEREMERRKR